MRQKFSLSNFQPPHSKLPQGYKSLQTVPLRRCEETGRGKAGCGPARRPIASPCAKPRTAARPGRCTPGWTGNGITE